MNNVELEIEHNKALHSSNFLLFHVTLHRGAPHWWEASRALVHLSIHLNPSENTILSLNLILNFSPYTGQKAEPIETESQ